MSLGFEFKPNTETSFTSTYFYLRRKILNRLLPFRFLYISILLFGAKADNYLFFFVPSFVLLKFNIKANNQP